MANENKNDFETEENNSLTEKNSEGIAPGQIPDLESHYEFQIPERFASLNTLSIYFTEREIRAFLKKNGYTIRVVKTDVEQHIHGSTFIGTQTINVLAEKGCMGGDYLVVFSNLLKQKLLSL